MPREVHPGRTYFVSRRTVGRFFLLRPDPNGAMAAIIIFCLAFACRLFGVQLHAAEVMSTHIHLVITDVHGVLPKFLQRFHRLVALATQCHRGWGEEVFNKSQTSVVELPTADAIIEKMAYTLANPVAAALVRFAREWPGLRIRVADIGRKVLQATRPRVFFRPERWAPRESVELVWPEAVLEQMSPEEAEAKLGEAFERHEREARDEVKRKGWSFRGRERCLRAPITQRSRAYEVWGSRNPTFATGGDPEVAKQKARERRSFRAQYREALRRWRQGERDVRFPAGTWLMRMLHGGLAEGAEAIDPAPS